MPLSFHTRGWIDGPGWIGLLDESHRPDWIAAFVLGIWHGSRLSLRWHFYEPVRSSGSNTWKEIKADIRLNGLMKRIIWLTDPLGLSFPVRTVIRKTALRAFQCKLDNRPRKTKKALLLGMVSTFSHQSIASSHIHCRSLPRRKPLQSVWTYSVRSRLTGVRRAAKTRFWLPPELSARPGYLWYAVGDVLDVEGPALGNKTWLLQAGYDIYTMKSETRIRFSLSNVSEGGLTMTFLLRSFYCDWK